MKKFIVPISVTTFIVLLAVLYFVFFSRADVYDAIPDSAVAVIEINDWSKFSHELNQKASAVEWRKTEAVKKMEDQVSFMEQLVASNMELKAAINNGKIAISAHLTSADDFDYLFTVPVKGTSNDDVFRAFGAGPGLASVTKRTFKAHTIVDVAMKDGKRFSFTVIRDVLAFSFTSFLTETSVTAVTSGNNLAHDKELRKVIKKLEDTGAVKLFINFKKADVIFPVVLKQQKIALLNDIIAMQGWSGYGISFQDDRIHLTGVSLVPGAEKTDVAAKNILANTIWNSIPDNAAYVNAGFNNLNTEVKGKADDNKMIKADFKDWAGEAHAFVTLEPLREDFNEQNVFVLQVTDESKAMSGLKHLISPDGTKPAATDTFMHVEIFNLKGGAVINRLFGGNFTVLGNTFFAISNHVAVFCNNADILKFTLEKISNHETLNKDANLRKAIGNQTTGTGMLYINPAKARMLFTGLIKDSSTLQTYLSTLNGISVVSNIHEAWNTTNASFVTGNGNKTSGGLLWKTKLQTMSDFIPQIVVNENTGEKEIFTQDTANNVYLLSKAGEIIFTKNIEEGIIGNVYQLEYHDDGKLQYIFNTATHVFLLDRLGNEVASYPLRLSSRASAGLTLVKSGERKYYYYVPCSNGAIYGYEASGRPLPGWSPKKAVGVIAKPMQHFENKKSGLMLAFNNAGKLMLLGSKGDVKWSVDNLPVTNQDFSIVQTPGDFLMMNAAGNQLIEISSDGNDKLKPLIDSAFSFAATATSDTAYQYFFSSRHDVRSYDNKGEFKNAVSLKSSVIGGIQVITLNDEKYLLVKDETMKKVKVYDLSLKPLADYAVLNTNVFTITDLFDRKELIGIQPDGNSYLDCYRIK